MAEELGKKIIFLETIEEQINVLENLSRDRIMDFLKAVDQWHTLAQDYVTYYLAGDPGAIVSKGVALSQSPLLRHQPPRPDLI